jgi:hypothetical protein
VFVNCADEWRLSRRRLRAVEDTAKLRTAEVSTPTAVAAALSIEAWSAAVGNSDDAVITTPTVTRLVSLVVGCKVGTELGVAEGGGEGCSEGKGVGR